MATTSTWSITYPTTANAITPLATHFANLASSTDSGLTAVRNQSGRYTGTNAQRLALTAALGRTEGTEFYTTDTDKNWLFDGTNWISSDPGLFVIVPAAAPSGYTVGADGSLVASNLSTGARNFDNIFSGRFRNYRIEATLYGKATGNETSTYWARVGTTTNTSANHFHTVFGVGTAGNPSQMFSAAAGSQTNLGQLDMIGSNNYITLEVGSPFIDTEPTNCMMRGMFRGGNYGERLRTSNLEVNTAVTGLAIDWGQTVASVRLRFYGYV